MSLSRDERLAYVKPLSNATIAPLILPLLRLSITDSAPFDETIIQHICDRTSSISPSPTDPIASTLLSALSPPDDTLANRIINWILMEVPTGQMTVFRPALSELASSQHRARASARAAIRLLDGETWSPENKFDDWALRSIRQNVQTPEQMAPYVEGLLNWMQDGNWPVFTGCCELMLRWPEVGVEPVRQILGEVDDGEWHYYLVSGLVSEWDCKLKERARGELRRIAEEPSVEEKEWELDEICREILREMDDAGACFLHAR